jgi:hypothetical protein
MNRLALFLIAFLLVSCSSSTSIPTSTALPIKTPTIQFCDANEINNFREQFMPLLQQYYDQVQATSAAPRTSVADEIERLKEVRIKVEGLISNLCTLKLRSALINAMNGSIDGFLAMSSGKPKSVQDSFFDKGTQFIREVNLELAHLADCNSNCEP